MNTYHICADCSAPDPTWASINRGVFLCNQCCSVHRVLGTHISHVRSLSSTNWPPVLKEMVYTLVKKGANNLWEHQLHDSHSKTKVRKPTPRDRTHPTKQDFILSKYKHLTFLPRISNKDNFNSIEDMSRQLHASVRTGNLETCLRLLALGADPNYLHTDRGNTPLHVAAQAGQAMQVELLVVNGADPCRLDRLGHTSEECARIAGHHQLAERLIECQYALTDKLSNFVSGRKPQHNIGEHFLAPQVGHSLSPGMADARNRLQEITNDLFEELTTDVYDEVDRRETDSVWLATQQLQSSIAFLPVNPTLSPLRNQGRQKLATLNAEEFAQLVIDILLDTKRRQAISVETGETSGTAVPMTSEDKIYDPHDYDEVPMDDSCSSSLLSLPRTASPGKPLSPLPPTPPLPKINSVSEGPFDGMYSLIGEKTDEEFLGDYAELKETPTQRSVLESEGAGVSRAKEDDVVEVLNKVQLECEQLRLTNQQLQEKVDDLQAQLNKVVEENARLRAGQPRTPTTPTSPLPVIKEPKEEKGREDEELLEMYAQVDKSKKKKSRSSVGGASTSGSRSSSSDQQTTQTSPPPPVEDLYTVPVKKSARNSSVATPPPTVTPPPPRQDTPLSDSPFEELAAMSSTVPLASALQATSPSHTAPSTAQPPTTTSNSSSPRTTTSSPPASAPSPATGPAAFLQAPPTLEEVQGYIKKITQPIQQLLQDAQSHKETSFGLYSIKIASTVDTLISIFPPSCSQDVMTSLRELKHAAYKLKAETTDVTTGHSDIAYRTKLIINSAYDVAKACRHLVTHVEQETNQRDSN